MHNTQHTQEQAIFSNSDELDPDFDIPYETCASAAFWALFLLQAAIGLIPYFKGQVPFLKRWPLYWM